MMPALAPHPAPAAAPRRDTAPAAYDQRRTPMVDAIRAYTAAGTLAFHVPGHKLGNGGSAGLRDLVGEQTLANDVWLETGAYAAARRDAQDLAAAAWGAARSYLLGNGSTTGNQAFLLNLLTDGAEVVVSRDLHASTLAALVMTGARPVYVVPRRHPEVDLGTGVHPDDVVAALRSHPAARLVSVVSPAYTGICSDVPAIVAAAHAHGALAYVDEAWGPHLAFHRDLPVHAMGAGADGAVTSVHKLLPALASGSLLMAADTIDGDRLDAAVRMTQTTSPFMPLLASIDLARRDLAVDGRRLVERAVELAGTARRGIARIAGLRVLDGEALGVAPDRLDPLKLVVDVSGLGMTGLEAERVLRGRLRIAPEGADLTSLFLVIALGDTPQTVAGLLHALRTLAATAGGARLPIVHPRSTGAVLDPGPAPLTPRQAWQARTAAVPLACAVGEVCAELVVPYPPGIPVLAPGELVTADKVDYLADAVGRGMHVHGTADEFLTTVRVVVDLPAPAH